MLRLVELNACIAVYRVGLVSALANVVVVVIGACFNLDFVAIDCRNVTAVADSVVTFISVESCKIMVCRIGIIAASANDPVSVIGVVNGERSGYGVGLVTALANVVVLIFSVVYRDKLVCFNAYLVTASAFKPVSVFVIVSIERVSFGCRFVTAVALDPVSVSVCIVKSNGAGQNDFKVSAFAKMRVLSFVEDSKLKVVSGNCGFVATVALKPVTVGIVHFND